MTDIIRDWLRRHPELTLTRQQTDDLEKLLDEDWSDPDDYDSYDLDDVVGAFSRGWDRGAVKMREAIVAHLKTCINPKATIEALQALPDVINDVEVPEAENE